jgi:nucleotide-binding universal stress UspA family protein
MSESNPPKAQRILVPMDFSDAARVASRTALRLASLPEDLVHIFYTPGFYAKTTTDAALASNPFSDSAEVAGRHFLAWTQAEGCCGAVEILPPRGNGSAPGVADMAIRLQSTLIVLTRHKSRFWERLFGGGPAEELARIAPCPVHCVDGPSDLSHESEPP